MKKHLIMLLALCLLASFTACGNNDVEAEESNSQTVVADSDSSIIDSESEDSESQRESEEDNWFLDDEGEEDQTEPDRWTNNH